MPDTVPVQRSGSRRTIRTVAEWVPSAPATRWVDRSQRPLVATVRTAPHPRQGRGGRRRGASAPVDGIDAVGAWRSALGPAAVLIGTAVTTAVVVALVGRTPVTTWLAPVAAVAVLAGSLWLVLRTRDAVTRSSQEAAEMEERVAADRREVARMRQSFLTNVSHELRTPLTNIVAYGETVSTHLTVLDTTRLGHLTDRLVVNARRLEQLVLDLLDLEELRGPEDGIQRRVTDVAELARQVQRDRGASETHRVVVRTSTRCAFVDGRKVRRILEELINNAVRHTPPGTSVEVTLDMEGAVLHLVVSDDGPGMRDVGGEAFQPFVQGQAASEQARPGLGVGLALVRGYAQAHGGGATYRPADGGGTRIDVWLDACLVPDGSAAPAEHDRDLRTT